MTAQVGNDHSEAVGKAGQLAPEETPAHAPAVDEDKRRPASSGLDRERDAAGANLGGHSVPPETAVVAGSRGLTWGATSRAKRVAQSCRTSMGIPGVAKCRM